MENILRVQLLTVKEAATLLRISPSTVYRRVNAGHLTLVRWDPRLSRVTLNDPERLLPAAEVDYV
ncbi:helix-turn-helix domain-containing protein [Bosea sp. RCC_152_1]|uniref:helix-turn-helix domain-containing protein n=1 Tax=Bosea sp. RCC_152_1 TaxID=3239228 RepID=UPI0035246B8B